MKIIFVNNQQFYELWNKSLPSQRITGNLPHPAMVFPHLNTLVLLKEGVELGSIEAMNPEQFSLSWFIETVTGKKYFEVA